MAKSTSTTQPAEKIVLGEAVVSKLTSSATLVSLVYQLYTKKSSAATADLRDILEELNTQATVLKETSIRERANVVTKYTDELMEKMKTRYKSLLGAVQYGLGSSDSAAEEAAKVLAPKTPPMSKIFTGKNSFVQLLKKQIAVFKTVDTAVFETLHCKNTIAEFETLVEDFENNFSTTVDKKVDTIGTVSVCFRRLKECYSDMLTALKNAQGPKKGAENKLVREFNQIFADFSAVQKQKASLKASKKEKPNEE